MKSVVNKGTADQITWVAVILATLWSFWLSSWMPPNIFAQDIMDLWFDADLPRVAQNMTFTEFGHATTFKHPIASILLYPLAGIFRILQADPQLAIRLSLALNAGLFIWLLDRLMGRLSLTRTDRSIALFLCLSASGFISWFGIADTFAFGASSILLALLFIDKAFSPDNTPAKARLYWACATFAATSITITNFSVAMLGTLIALLSGRDIKQWSRTCLAGGFIGMVALTFVAIIQDQIFGEAGLFFNIPALISEKMFIGGDHIIPLPARLQTLYLQTMVMGSPVLSLFSFKPWDYPILDVDGRWPGTIIGYAAITGWAITLAIIFVRLWQSRRALPPVITVAAVFFAANTILHLIYGQTVYLYVAHFTGPIILIAAWAIFAKHKTAPKASPRPFTLLHGAIAILAVVMLISNIHEYKAAWAILATTPNVANNTSQTNPQQRLHYKRTGPARNTR